jgi:hypothetical protein
MTRDPNSPMNELMRGQKADRDKRTEDRQARFFKPREPEPEPDDLAAARAEAREAREQADSARRQAEAARARAGS